MSKINRCVVRNQAYRAGEFSLRERHNERKNECYGNGDIDKNRSHRNVYFKKCKSTYKQEFDRLVNDGTISLRGLGKNPKVFDELVFDVNTRYFNNLGGYEYAKDFFEEAYKVALKEIGGEKYVLSAVMHADERNKAESERLGRDVYHYHLHVTYIPVVEKKVYFRKNNKNPELAGKLKETVMQVSHSKKWAREKQVDEQGDIVRNEKGQAVLVNSYSLLQDRFFKHMNNAGYLDFERGEHKSNAEHLTTIEYKVQQESKRMTEMQGNVDILSAAIDKKVNTAKEIDMKISQEKQKYAVIHQKTATREGVSVTFSELEEMVKHKLFGKVELSAVDWEHVLNLAKKGVLSKPLEKEFKREIEKLKQDIELYKTRCRSILEETKDIREAMKRAPNKMFKTMQEIFQNVPEYEKSKQQHRGNKDYDR
jgi:Plasmid recombination enzyme.